MMYRTRRGGTTGLVRLLALILAHCFCFLVGGAKPLRPTPSLSHEAVIDSVCKDTNMPVILLKRFLTRLQKKSKKLMAMRMVA